MKTLTGIIHSKTIELSESLGLPDDAARLSAQTDGKRKMVQIVEHPRLISCLEGHIGARTPIAIATVALGIELLERFDFATEQQESQLNSHLLGHVTCSQTVDTTGTLSPALQSSSSNRPQRRDDFGP